MSDEGYPGGIHVGVGTEIVHCPAQSPGPAGEGAPLVRSYDLAQIVRIYALGPLREAVVVVRVHVPAIVGRHTVTGREYLLQRPASGTGSARQFPVVAVALEVLGVRLVYVLLVTYGGVAEEVHSQAEGRGLRVLRGIDQHIYDYLVFRVQVYAHPLPRGQPSERIFLDLQQLESLAIRSLRHTSIYFVGEAAQYFRPAFALPLPLRLHPASVFAA